MLAKVEHELRMSLYLQGKNDREIANVTHYVPKTISAWRYRNGLKSNFNPNWKRADYKAMDEMLMRGISQGEIARTLGCSKTLVHLRAKGKRGKRSEM